MKKRLIYISLCFLSAVAAQAEKLDLSAHNAIIQKLESAASVSTDDSMVQSASLIYRLADLYAERARLLSMEEQGLGATKNAAQISADRKKAIAALTRVQPALPQEKKGSALMQTAHLYELQLQSGEALKIYKLIEKNPRDYDQKTKALTEIKLGDDTFAKGDLDAAQKHFEKALTYSENPRKAYAHYRLAWVHFNLGQTLIAEKKLLTLLQTPKLYKNADGEIDQAFVEEATHDLATFVARNDLQQTNLKTYLSVTPEVLQKKNLIFLAQELDRTAKKVSALKVWAVVGTQQLTFEDQVERQIQMTRIEYDLGHLPLIIIELNKSILVLKKSECKGNETCTLAQQNLRRVITDWARAEERKVSPELISAFNAYTSNFEDYEMNFWAAGLAVKRKQHQDAFNFYLRASTILKEISSKNAQQQKLFEASLVGGIEMAEFAKDPQLKVQAYRRYLEFNPNGAQKNEVKYQIARWYYDQNQYPTARDEFKKLALDQTMTLSLREKSADLCLDTNVLLKDEARIETDSFELAGQIPNKKSEYLNIFRKSILNQSAAILNATSADDKLKSELAKLNKTNAKSFAGEEKLQLLKNKMELAYRLKDVDQLISYSNQFLTLKSLKPADQQKAFHYLAWTSEIRMNFKEALKYLKKIQPAPKDLAAYYLKTALLKELSSQNPTKEYEMYMSVSRDHNKVAFAAHQIVLHSANSLKAFNKYESVLKKNQDLYPSAALFVFEKTNDSHFAKRILSHGAFKNSAEASLVRHKMSFDDMRLLVRQVSQSKFKTGNDLQIKKSLVQRNELIHQLEKATNRSIAKKDIVEQLIFLPVLVIENNRLAQDILSTPKPKKMSKEEKIAYDQQLKILVDPYQTQALAIENKVKELFKQEPSQQTMNELSAWAAQVNRPGHKLALQELSLLKGSVLNLGLTSPAFEKLSERKQKVSSKLTEASSLQMKIYKSPFDFSYLEKMKNLQLSLGSGPMVAYIDSRIDELNSRGR